MRSGELRVAAADPRRTARRLRPPDDWGASLGRDTTFVPAPAYDEEHPEELSYRPFPIAPFLTATASADDPALARMVHPDLAKTLEMLDQAGSAPPMRLRPGPQPARLMWAQQFKGEAINLVSLLDPDAHDGLGRPRQPHGGDDADAVTTICRLTRPATQRGRLRPASDCLRDNAKGAQLWGCGSGPCCGPGPDWRLRRSRMNSSNSARSLAMRSRSRKSRNSVASSSRRRSASLAVLVEGAVAARAQAVVAVSAAPVLHAPLPALALALPALGSRRSRHCSMSP